MLIIEVLTPLIASRPVAANIAKFRGSDGKPMRILSDGSGPTGTAPLAYFHLDDGEAVANFALNRGTGGDFTVVNGPLAQFYRAIQPATNGEADI